MLRFIYGTAGCGETDFIYGDAQRIAESGGTVFILVPEQYSMYAEHELLTRLGLSAQSRIRVLTFSRLAGLVFARKGPLRMKYIDKAGKYMLMQRSLQAAAKDLTVLRRGAAKPGFAKAMTSVVSEFKRYGVSPARLSRAAEETSSAKLRMKLSDMSTVYEKYTELLQNGYADAEDNLTMVTPRLAGCDFLRGTFYINFFRSFTPCEYAVLGELLRIADLNVVLTADSLTSPSDVFLPQGNAFRRLAELAKGLEVDILPPVQLTDEVRFAASPELLHLKNNCFAGRYKTYEKDTKAIHVIRSANCGSEVADCARLIIHLLRTRTTFDNGVERPLTFNDFLIITGSMESYERIIPPVFEEFGIRCFLDKKTALSENPIMRTVISVLEICAYGFSYERVMTLVRADCLGIRRSDADMFENYILAADLMPWHWTRGEDWSYNPDPKRFRLSAVNRVRSAVTAPVADFMSRFEGRKTVSEICSALLLTLRNMGLQKTAARKIAALKSDGMDELAEQTRLVWNSLVSVINQMSEYMGGEYITFTAFCELFCSSCGELSVGIVPPTRDKVIISSADRFRSTGAKIVIALGVNDRSFPRGRAADGIITDAERLILAEEGLELAPDSYGKSIEARFLVYSTLTSASDMLFIFSPVSDNEGKSLGSSEIVSRISKIFPRLKIQSGVSGIVPAEIAPPEVEGREHSFRRLSEQLFSCGLKTENLSSEWREAYEYFRTAPKYPARLKKIEKMYEYGAAPIRLTCRMARTLYGSPMYLSVSKLEKYNSCAFSFFMRYGLFAEERAIGGLEANNVGSILHSVLCDYFRETAAKDADYSKITREECAARISELTDAAAKANSEVLYEASPHYKYMIMKIRGIAAATAWKTVKFYAGGSFRPVGMELSFGRNCELPPKVIAADGSEVYLEGIIDRIDGAEIGGQKYIAVTDYKSSRKELDADLMEAGIRFQPLIYANTVCEAYPGARTAAMLYLQMSDPIAKFDDEPQDFELQKSLSDSISADGLVLDSSDVLTALDSGFFDPDAIHHIPSGKKSLINANELEKMLQSADAKAKESAEKIISGEICAEPSRISGSDPCSYCPYGSICNKKV